MWIIKQIQKHCNQHFMVKYTYSLIFFLCEILNLVQLYISVTICHSPAFGLGISLLGIYPQILGNLEIFGFKKDFIYFITKYVDIITCPIDFYNHFVFFYHILRISVLFLGLSRGEIQGYSKILPPSLWVIEGQICDTCFDCCVARRTAVSVLSI